jgi:hypothetical protein
VKIRKTQRSFSLPSPVLSTAILSYYLLIRTGFVDEKIESEGVIEEDKQPEEIRQEPYELNEKFEWSTIDIENGEQVGFI